MEIIGWLLLAALLVLSPLSWIKPTPRHKKLVRIRDEARGLGIKVTLTPLKLKNGTSIQGSAYRWLRSPDSPVMPGYLCLLRKDREEARPVWEEWTQGWVLAQGKKSFLTEAQQQEFNAWLQTLPENVFAVEWGSATLAVWWDERGEPEILSAWHDRVQELLALPCKHPGRI
ncbi:hypothetical protein [Marinospirillum sp.]|uniref:hypothetical protein n=1 Tax=Marinospirillum sp. TaxID=2183934 RepID=UPI00384A51A9